MVKKVVSKCPVCGEDMTVKSLECPNCRTEIRGRFELGKFSKLSQKQLEFVEVFIRTRGNIKEVEEELGISYPTVRKKLDEVIQALGFSPGETPENGKTKEREEVLEALNQGEIDFQEAKKKLKKLQGGNLT